MWLTPDLFVAGRAVDVSLHGMRVVRGERATTDLLGLGDTYRVDVKPEPSAEVRCVAKIRYVGQEAIGFETQEALPVAYA